MRAHHEPIHDIAHLGGVELYTPKFESTLWYFRDVLGMELVEQSGPSAYLRGYGDYATSTLKLTEHAAAGVGCVSWRATSPEALERRVAAIEQAGSGSAGAMEISAVVGRTDFTIRMGTSWSSTSRSSATKPPRTCIPR